MNVAFYSLAGIAVGALLQYLFTRVLEDRRHLRDLRTQAYSDYLRAVSESRHLLIQRQALRERELLARLTDAKARLCLYGTAHVLALLARFEGLGGTLHSTDQQEAFVALLGAMRQSPDVEGADLELVILGGENASDPRRTNAERPSSRHE